MISKFSLALFLILGSMPSLALARDTPRTQRAMATSATIAIDLNAASEAELSALPGIGPKLARRILQSRAERPFTRVSELGRVRGIGPKKLAALRSRVRVAH